MSPVFDDARVTRILEHLATEAVANGWVAAFPPPAALAELSTFEARRLLDGLLTIRPPFPLDDDVAADLDVLLAGESAERVAKAGHPRALELPTLARTHGVSGPLGEHVALWRGDLTTLEAGAIVNAANSGLLGCRQPGHTCIDNVIHSVAGPGLRAQCARHSEDQGGRPEPVGTAVLTDGYHLPAEYVIHTVGPQVDGVVTEADREGLASCYRSVLDVVLAQGIASVGLCSVSTGAFGYPKDEAAELVVGVLDEWCRAHEGAPVRVVVCVFSEADERAYASALARTGMVSGGAAGA